MNDCDECGGLGILGRDPDGEIVYCEGCPRGLRLAMTALRWHMMVDHAWLERHAATGEPDEIGQAIFEEECTEYDRLHDLWAGMRTEGDGDEGDGARPLWGDDWGPEAFLYTDL